MKSRHSFSKPALLASTMLLSGVAPGLSPVYAAEADKGFSLEEIVVTAQKRESNLQDVAVSVQVLGNKQLEDLNVNAFDDYIQFLPTVSFQSSRPGVAQIYMRGISSGGDGNHSASMPSVGVYLDEQPITTINQVLDLHVYDVARIETLSGPQGTLFGASSQAGTMRIITNKPVIGEFEAGYDVAVNSVSHGEMGYTLEGYVNLPVSEKSAIRLVGWHEKDGGYIDNVPAELNYLGSGITINNDDLVEDDFNDTSTTGMRALLKFDLNENWTITPGITYQKQKSTGVFSHDPEDLGDLNTREFFPTEYDEDWYQASLTVEGKIGDMDIVYAGSYLNRNVDSIYDYSGYAEYLESFGYCYYYDAGGNCVDPSQYVLGDEKYKRQSHELRIESPAENRLRFIAGVFYQRQTHDFDLQWVVPEMNPADSVIEGGTTTWQTKQVRTDREYAAFSEISYDLTEKLTLLGGVRFYKYDNSLYGFNGFIGHCTGSYVDGVFVEDRENGTPQYPCFDTKILDGRKKNSDVLFKLNLTYQIDDDKMVYATYSEGYRPGGVNRARVPNIPGYDEDFVTNYELGWKTSWLDNRLRFNGAAYYMKWSDIQFNFLDFTVSNLTIIQNVGGARTYGAEFDLDFAATENLTVSFSGSYNDAKLTSEYKRSPDSDVLAPPGTRMPYVPVFQFTSSARYEQDIADIPSFFQASLSYTGDSWSNLDLSIREKQHNYALLNLSAGISGDGWTFSVFADNVTDTRAEISKFYPGYPSEVDTTIATNRPRTIGLRFGQKF
ncbi:TonB-dependent receptor [Kordiimonas pumila]|uniref:TonB-dependent receptor n=1 Tax=Kordiimonas pumila TaxID=2161677 RepID=A0ABV7D443_9PROT|nr:TonB-dependent receptor [Kordiimonas pumila]